MVPLQAPEPIGHSLNTSKISRLYEYFQLKPLIISGVQYDHQKQKDTGLKSKLGGETDQSWGLSR